MNYKEAFESLYQEVNKSDNGQLSKHAIILDEIVQGKPDNLKESENTETEQSNEQNNLKEPEISIGEQLAKEQNERDTKNKQLDPWGK